MNDEICFAKKGKLSPRYVGSYKNLKRIEEVLYEMDFPSELGPVYLVFHISTLK